MKITVSPGKYKENRILRDETKLEFHVLAKCSDVSFFTMFKISMQSIENLSEVLTSDLQRKSEMHQCA